MRLLASLTFILLLLVPKIVTAGAPKAFTQAEFDKLLKAKSPVMIDIYADWCPTCKRQAEVLGPIMAEPGFKKIVVLKVNYDTQKDAVKGFKASRQSTLIIFKGGAELDRSVAETSPERLRTFVEKLK